MDAVLVDDDILVHLMWSQAAKQHSKHLLKYESRDALIAALPSIPKNTPIYLDSHLGSDLKGEDLAQVLHALGFSQLHLATGSPERHFEPMPWLTSIVGKEAPWDMPASTETI